MVISGTYQVVPRALIVNRQSSVVRALALTSDIPPDSPQKLQGSVRIRFTDNLKRSKREREINVSIREHNDERKIGFG